MAYVKNEVPVEGTIFFDGDMARKGYGLNKMCFSFNEAKAREEFVEDEMAYCDRFGLTEAQKKAVHDRDVLKLIEEGGNIYYLAKFAGLLGMNMQDIGALQTGMSLEEFKQKLVDAGR
ncbi:protocatechuate 4,5-dioxygenase subunit alpha [Vibrio sp. B1FLJ16]|uniref:protocatechuate 4,5-dioxygenase subunit alpha n=1 Tax=Vibrio sp. B1FLJ16 TaxID=2751178 RepID=UPI0015F4064C|nr:protocatechuate 4,5-dioxygenase subunit alpha [Vibrio sp. B1FLJ16]CAD7817857.1 Protocatechuate 4,5-dioxygenase alpha chain [Vibrio sp. B1FLJ16]CAD7818909.1 Protocatechuate 4,5-dioxygenase alpha chain [Vibrio sp. B1FLJ16]CAE6932498.1 Protocatechuate 4,5-dioxygenase alpha chain [Vibrio sp. B1FLJ16]CAE6936606.1 Protocatechuate 4,5-dioxygenase alpha chain [Vibrio sp. B1FLJ16]